MQARPSIERMETEPAFIAKPAFIDFDIPAADSAVNLAIRGGVTRNPTTDGARGVIDAQVAAGAASSADRIRTLEKPHADFESKISARQRSDRTDIDDIHRVWIV